MLTSFRASNASGTRHPHARQGGTALLAALLMLLVVGVLAITMFRGMGQQEMSAGNTLDKQRADEAAQSALQFGEWWLREGNAAAPQACTGAEDISSLKVCDAPLATPAEVPWDAGFAYRPAEGFVVNDARGLADSGDVNYAALPELHIAYLGRGGASGSSPVYQLTATARGGRSDTVSVVQSTYALSGVRVSDMSQ